MEFIGQQFEQTQHQRLYPIGWARKLSWIPDSSNHILIRNKKLTNNYYSHYFYVNTIDK